VKKQKGKPNEVGKRGVANHAATTEPEILPSKGKAPERTGTLKKKKQGGAFQSTHEKGGEGREERKKIRNTPIQFGDKKFSNGNGAMRKQVTLKRKKGGVSGLFGRRQLWLMLGSVHAIGFPQGTSSWELNRRKGKRPGGQ